MVANEYRIDWMALAPDAISAHHGNTSLAISLDQGYDKFHAEMVKICHRMALTSLIGEGFQLGGRDVGDEDLCMARWLSLNMLWYVADGEVHRVC